MTPGVGATVERATPSGRTNGNYVEYAYKIVEQGRTRTVSGLWWDDAQTPTAAFLLAAGLMVTASLVTWIFLNVKHEELATDGPQEAPVVA